MNDRQTVTTTACAKCQYRAQSECLESELGAVPSIRCPECGQMALAIITRYFDAPSAGRSHGEFEWPEYIGEAE